LLLNWLETNRHLCKLKLTKKSFNFLVYMRKFLKDIILSILINAWILYWLNYYQFWLSINTSTANEIEAYFILGFIFWIVNFWLKKVINMLSFPLRWLSFWLISILINVWILYFFEYYINANYSQIATVSLSWDWIRVLIISVVVSIAYSLLSKLLK
jgi:uncharacterized membrane protein YvlD (DUF360 family)